MRFVEIDLFGLYVAPIAVMIVVAWGITLLLRIVVYRLGLMGRVWHPPLFWFSVYVTSLSALVLAGKMS